MKRTVSKMRTMEERAISALHSTWQAIGYDCLVAMTDKAHPTERDIDRVVLRGDDVQEAVSTCGFVGGYPADYGDDIEAVRWLEKLPRAEQERILESAFPNSNRYGS